MALVTRLENSGCRWADFLHSCLSPVALWRNPQRDAENQASSANLLCASRGGGIPLRYFVSCVEVGISRMAMTKVIFQKGKFHCIILRDTLTNLSLPWLYKCRLALDEQEMTI